MLAANARPVLSLAEIEANDPGTSPHGTERRFLCPLPACADHRQPGQHRSLAVNVETGAWVCHRCGAAGKLIERWTDPRESARNRLRAAFHVTVQKLVPEPVSGHYGPAGDPAAAPRSRPDWLDFEPVSFTPGSHYLQARGIGED